MALEDLWVGDIKVLEVQEGQVRCLMCAKWATEEHLKSVYHMRWFPFVHKCGTHEKPKNVGFQLPPSLRAAPPPCPVQYPGVGFQLPPSLSAAPPPFPIQYSGVSEVDLPELEWFRCPGKYGKGYIF